MQVVKHTETNKVIAAPTTTIWEYSTPDKDLSGAIAQINGRYPEKGFAVNEVSKELVYVLEGTGSIVLKKGRSFEVSKGDVILLIPNEPYAWNGNLTLFMTNTPSFDPKQHKIVE